MKKQTITGEIKHLREIATHLLELGYVVQMDIDEHDLYNRLDYWEDTDEWESDKGGGQ